MSTHAKANTVHHFHFMDYYILEVFSQKQQSYLNTVEKISLAFVQIWNSLKYVPF